MDELLRHKIFLDEAIAWRREGMSVEVASEWGRYRLAPDDVRAWTAYGFRARAAYTCKSVGFTAAEGAAVYEQGEHPAVAAARKAGATAVWIDEHPARDAPPHALLSWDDDEDGPKVPWWRPKRPGLAPGPVRSLE